MIINTQKKYLYYLLLIQFSAFITCDAPRKNPLDPNNSDNIYRILSGRVQTIRLPAQPISEVKVFWLGQIAQTETNLDGNFSIESVGSQNGWLHFEKEGYLPDSTFVQWLDKKSIFVEISLNASPMLDSLLVYCVILNRYPSLQKEQIIVEAQISDDDNDIDSVQVFIAYNDFSADLIYNVSSRWYERSFTIFDLNIPSAERLVGHDFQIMVKDIFGHRFDIGSNTIERVIREEVIFLSPAGNDTTSATPILTWVAFQPGFTFSYQLQVFTAEITPQLVWEKAELQDSLTSYTVDSTLPSGEYYWVIWAIDEFGNRTRSKPASFVVG
jgi:hypothetical protein